MYTPTARSRCRVIRPTSAFARHKSCTKDGCWSRRCVHTHTQTQSVFRACEGSPVVRLTSPCKQHIPQCRLQARRSSWLQASCSHTRPSAHRQACLHRLPLGADNIQEPLFVLALPYYTHVHTVRLTHGPCRQHPPIPTPKDSTAQGKKDTQKVHRGNKIKNAVDAHHSCTWITAAAPARVQEARPAQAATSPCFGSKQQQWGCGAKHCRASTPE